MENKQEYEQYRMLSKGAQAELVEKKSRFIATIRPVSSEEEAVAFIEEMKKKHQQKTEQMYVFNKMFIIELLLSTRL